jgi:ferredoxin-NADP reductase
VATVEEIHAETTRLKSFRLRLAEPRSFFAGQHFVLRLRAPDGYTAQRSYSAASAPDGGGAIELVVERLPDGEVSTFLHDELRVGDRLEVRGPIGGHFTWTAGEPALLVGGGAGLVPLVSMLRLARALGVPERARLVASVRGPGDLPFAAELAGPQVHVVYTREAPPGSPRAPGRLTAADLAAGAAGVGAAYVCGSAAFADTVTALLGAVGLRPGRIRVERFGPSG